MPLISISLLFCATVLSVLGNDPKNTVEFNCNIAGGYVDAWCGLKDQSGMSYTMKMANAVTDSRNSKNVLGYNCIGTGSESKWCCKKNLRDPKNPNLTPITRPYGEVDGYFCAQPK